MTTNSTETPDVNGFHRKYRPANLSKIIGHEQHVARLQGIVKSNKLPSALFFGGPSSAGKTTLARAFAADLNGVKSVDQLQGSYIEFNAAADSTKDQVREWIKISKFKPPFKSRVIVVDESQALLSTPQSLAALLKPVEEPTPGTLWVFCSMEPSRFTASENGRALLNRCQQFILAPHTPDDLLKQAKRIMKAEDMGYVESVLKTIVRNAPEMRSLANLMEALSQWAAGQDKKPKSLTKDQVQEVLKSTQSSDDELSVRVLLAVLSGQYKQVVRNLLDVAEPFMFVTKLQWGASHLLRVAALEGGKHQQIKYWAKSNKDLQAQVDKLGLKLSLSQLAALNESLVNIKGELMVHASSAIELLEARLYRTIKILQDLKK